MYRVVYPFWDMEDETKHAYKKDDKFPFDGRKISEKRINELMSTNNRIGEILISLEDESSEDNQDLTDENSEDNKILENVKSGKSKNGRNK